MSDFFSEPETRLRLAVSYINRRASILSCQDIVRLLEEVKGRHANRAIEDFFFQRISDLSYDDVYPLFSVLWHRNSWDDPDEFDGDRVQERIFKAWSEHLMN